MDNIVFKCRPADLPTILFRFFVYERAYISKWPLSYYEIYISHTPFYFNVNHICLKALKIDIYHETGQPYEIKKLCILKNFLFTIYIYIYLSADLPT